MRAGRRVARGLMAGSAGKRIMWRSEGQGHGLRQRTDGQANIVQSAILACIHKRLIRHAN